MNNWFFNILDEFNFLKSCIIKFACAFNIEVYKETGFEDLEEEKDYQKFIKEFKV